MVDITIEEYKKIYYNEFNMQTVEWKELKNLTLNEKPMAMYCKVNGKDSLIFYSKKDGMFVWDILMSNAYKVDNPPDITSMCIHNDRLFATIDGDARSIIFSEELNPINFNIHKFYHFFLPKIKFYTFINIK